MTAKAHGGVIDIQGVTVATVNEKLQLQSVRTWFDPLDMFRQIAPEGVVKKEAVDKSLSPGDALDSDSRAVELSQKPAVDETTLPANHPGKETMSLAEDVGCPFANTSPKEATAPFPPATVDKAAAKEMTRQTGEGNAKLSHPELPMSEVKKKVLASGQQEGFDQDPHLTSSS